MFRTIFESLSTYPMGALLFFVAFLNLIWVFYTVFIKHNFKYSVYRAYFLYALLTIIWVISNAYFQSSLLNEFGSKMATYVGLIANIAISLSASMFYYISCCVRNKRPTKLSWYIIIFHWAATLLFNLIPGLTVIDVVVFKDGSFELIQGPWTGVFFLIAIIVFFLSIINFIVAIKNSKARIENIRVFYVLFALSLLYSSVILFLIILPYYYQNYNYAWIPPLVSVADVLIVGYAILTQRFLDIRLVIYRFFKVLLSFVVASLIGFGISVKLARTFTNIELFHWELIGIALILYIFNKLIKILNSRSFYSYFGGTDAEHIQYIMNDLRKKGNVYTSIKEYEKDIQKAFSKKLRKINPQIIIVNSKFKKRYRELFEYFKKNRGMLITEELKFVEANKVKMTPFLEELESLGGICIPLFHPSKGLVALFTLGQKKYNHLYTKEEISALESLGSFLNVTVTNILYNSELQAEVNRKTKQLERKINQVNELLDQQSDFIAVTAHEFRTPISIASFQLEEILHSKGNKENLIRELSFVDESIRNLKLLTEKLFAIQQYDLNKVSLNKEKVLLIEFIKSLYNEFIPLMNKEGLKFELKIKTKKELIVEIDKLQMRQVMHNLLKNASKFTPKGGKIDIVVDEEKSDVFIRIIDNGPGIPQKLKKSIFEKFRTKSAGAGIGLGLYLCKKIVELHKGRIWVEDGPEGGASFYIRLKLSK